jgi:hypothetical protein
MPNTTTNIPPQYSVPVPGNLPTSVNNPTQTNNLKNQATGSLSSFQSQVETIKGKQSDQDPYKNISDPSAFIKEQKITFSKNQVISILLPVVSKFLNAEYVANLLIAKLEKQTREQLQNKGTLTVTGGKYVFVPSDANNYSIFKQNFDNKVRNLQKSVNALQSTITLVNNVIKILNIGLSITQLYIKIKLASLLKKHIQITADLASPSPSKSSGLALLKVTQDILKVQKYEKKVEEYQIVIASAQGILSFMSNSLSVIKKKLDELSFTINTPTSISPNSGVEASSLTNDIQSIAKSAPLTEEYTDAYGKSYTLNLVTLPNGSIQYQALDSFSKMKITQTAPSKIKTAEELNNEIKSILG